MRHFSILYDLRGPRVSPPRRKAAPTAEEAADRPEPSVLALALAAGF